MPLTDEQLVNFYRNPKDLIGTWWLDVDGRVLRVSSMEASVLTLASHHGMGRVFKVPLLSLLDVWSRFAYMYDDREMAWVIPGSLALLRETLLLVQIQSVTPTYCATMYGDSDIEVFYRRVPLTQQEALQEIGHGPTSENMDLFLQRYRAPTSEEMSQYESTVDRFNEVMAEGRNYALSRMFPEPQLSEDTPIEPSEPLIRTSAWDQLTDSILT